MTLDELDDAARIVYDAMRPTTQQRWPLLDARAGGPVWVKHENQTPVGAFKIRGGVVYCERLLEQRPDVKGLVAATRGNHGQSIAFAARRRGLPVAVIVPRGNSVDKNRAMMALGAELIEHGDDFQASLEAAEEIAMSRGWHKVPSFHPWLISGVASWALELLRAEPRIDHLYVPVGLGSGICGAIAVRDALGLSTKIVAVVASAAPAYALSLRSGRPVSHDATTAIADGMACRTPAPAALTIIGNGIDRLVQVSDDQIEHAMRALFEDTHNVAEGAAAAGLAALLAEPAQRRPGTAAIVLTGANVDADVFARVLTKEHVHR